MKQRLYDEGFRERYAVGIGVSLLLHFLLIVLFLLDPIQIDPSPLTKTVQVTLSTPTPQPQAEKQEKAEEEKKEEKEEVSEEEIAEKPKEEAAEQSEPDSQDTQPHAPRHDAEEYSTSNQTDKTQKTLVDGSITQPTEEKTKLSDNTAKQQSKAKDTPAQEQLDTAKDTLADKKELEQKSDVRKTQQEIASVEAKDADIQITDKDSAAQEILDINDLGTEIDLTDPSQLAQMDEILENYDTEGGDYDTEFDLSAEIDRDIGNVNLLSDQQLADVEVEDPFSEKESEEIRLVNKYLKRMQEQVMKVWENPYSGNKMHRGVIRLELDEQGYLVDRFVYRSSGIAYLDQSVLDALDAIDRFLVPENPVIAERYYTNLRFFYSSIEEEYELMPFEIEEN